MTVRLDLQIEDFWQLLAWAIDHQDDSPEAAKLQRILYAKGLALLRRELYTKYKRAATDGEARDALERYIKECKGL